MPVVSRTATFTGIALCAIVVSCLVVSRAAAGESWSNPPKTLPAGAVHKTFTSASMKTEVGYCLYLPPQYAAEPQRRFPVLYYLHGRGGTESSHPNAFKQLDDAIRAGTVPPMIYVHAMAGRNSGYVDAPDGSVMGETVVIKELIPHIDATYRTIPERKGRAIQGFSKGGQGALLYAFKFPDLFSSVIGYAAGLASGAELQKELPAVFKLMHGDSVHQFDDTSAWAWARRNADKLKSGIAISIVLGDKDYHIIRNRRMHALLDELAVPHQYKELPGIGHDTGKVYQLVGGEGFAFHAANFKP